MCLSLQTVSFKEFSRIVYVFHCSVIKVLICSLSFATACLLYHFQNPLSTTFFQLFLFLSVVSVVILWLSATAHTEYHSIFVMSTTNFVFSQKQQISFFRKNFDYFISSVSCKKTVSWYIHKHRATLTSTTPRLQARSERSRSTRVMYIPGDSLFAADTSPLKSLNLCSTKQESPHTSEVFSREFPAAYHTP